MNALVKRQLIVRPSLKAKALRGFAGAILFALGAMSLKAEEAATPSTNAPSATPAKEAAANKAEKPPPLPLHQIEGNGGIFATLSAYLVNPPRNGEPVGRPSVGFSHVHLGYGRALESFTVTETPWKRLELGYGYNNLDLGDLPYDIYKATKLSIRSDSVTQQNFNARLAFLKENEFDQKWLPALTGGIHYKYNSDFNRIDEDLSGTLRAHGLSNHEGLDFTLYASKMLTFLPRPVLINVGGRATKGAQLGLLGFTDEYSFVFEGSVVVFVTDRLALAAEYKQKPNDYQPISGLVGKEDDWITLDAAYVVNNHFTVAAGYGHFGQVVNHEANGVWGLTAKWEF